MAKPISYKISLSTAAATNGIATSQTVASAATIAINGALATSGIATLPQVRRIGIKSAGDDTAVTFTINGTDWWNHSVTESLVGVSNAVAQSVLDYSTVNNITVSAGTTSLQVGTTGVGDTPPLRLDYYGFPQVALQVDVSGTVNYTVQSTVDNLNDASLGGSNNPTTYNWVNSSDGNVVAASTTQQSNFAYAPSAVRLVVNSGTGTATLTLIQAGPGILST